ncbi:MAG: hypothetical protein FJ279_32450 [Planctomycetes bacterium]|nr:hypothetical protein [Planctomycetota bacterium]
MNPSRHQPSTVGGISSQEYALDGTLTNLALSVCDRAVFINDLERAEATGHYRRICPSAVCALACPVCFRGRFFGVLVVLSEKYDLFEDSHGRLLELLAQQASEIFARRELVDKSAALVGLRHDVVTVLGEISDRVKQLCAGHPLPEDLDRLFEFVSETLCTYLRHGQDAPAFFEAHECFPTVILDEIRTVERVLRLDMPENCGVDLRVDPALTVRINGAFLMSIVYNLLKNAWIASPQGSQPVVVSATETDGFLELRIRDHGAGMTAEEAEKYREWDPLKVIAVPPAEVAGVGILLANRVAGWHGLADGRKGEVKLVWTELGSGTEFLVRLPISTSV